MSILLGAAQWLLLLGSTAYHHRSPSSQAVEGFLPMGLFSAPLPLGTPTPHMSGALSQAWPPQRAPLVVGVLLSPPVLSPSLGSVFH